jgi:hypothetical protein
MWDWVRADGWTPRSSVHVRKAWAWMNRLRAYWAAQIGVAGVTAALRSRCDQLSVELLTSVRRRLRRPPGILGACSFVPCVVVRQAAVAVADHEGLAEDRVKDAVKGFLPGPDPDAQRFYSSDSLIVDVAFPPASWSR